MRDSFTPSLNFTNASQELTEQSPAKPIVLRRISAAELAMKIRSG